MTRNQNCFLWTCLSACLVLSNLIVQWDYFPIQKAVVLYLKNDLRNLQTFLTTGNLYFKDGCSHDLTAIMPVRSKDILQHVLNHTNILVRTWYLTEMQKMRQHHHHPHLHPLWYRVLFYSLGWHWTPSDPPVSVSGVPRLQTCVTCPLFLFEGKNHLSWANWLYGLLRQTTHFHLLLVFKSVSRKTFLSFLKNYYFIFRDKVDQDGLELTESCLCLPRAGWD